MNCPAFDKDDRVCKNGFIQNTNCRSPRLCGCGESYLKSVYTKDAPPCLLDELPERHINDDGSPKYYRPASPLQ